MYEFFPTARNEDLVVQEAEPETLVYDLLSNKAHHLNETASLIWKLCDGEKSVRDIGNSISVKTGLQVNDELVWVALNDLSRNKLLKSDIELPENLKGFSRREMIRKAGLGAMVALPVIASLVAPLPIHANSSCAAGGSCTCNATSGGRQGQICTASVPCADTNCRCAWANNGNAQGTCVP
jgi:hypothetical protein